MIISQLKNGYRYNSDTMFLYDFVSENRLFGNVLDVGCGCGILGLLLKRDNPKILLFLLDILSINLNIARQNLLQNNLEAECILADFRNYETKLKFDYIISNPPFYHSGVKESQNEHKSMARYANNLKLREFIAKANSLLLPKGILYFCYDAKQLGEILLILKEYKLTPTRIKMIHSRSDKDANLVLFEAKKSSKSLTKILPPLFVFENGVYSKKANEIFAKAATQSKDF